MHGDACEAQGPTAALEYCNTAGQLPSGDTTTGVGGLLAGALLGLARAQPSAPMAWMAAHLRANSKASGSIRVPT